MIWLSEFWKSDFRCEELMFLRFYLQVLNDRMFKTNKETFMKMEKSNQADNHN